MLKYEFINYFIDKNLHIKFYNYCLHNLIIILNNIYCFNASVSIHNKCNVINLKSVSITSQMGILKTHCLNLIPHEFIESGITDTTRRGNDRNLWIVDTNVVD